MSASRTAVMLLLRNNNFNIPLSLARGFSRSAVVNESRALAKMKSDQAKFQCENGVPIFLKAGARDRILYTTTLVLSALGVVGSILAIYDQAKPTSWKTGGPVC